jgi:hypothetical protein
MKIIKLAAGEFDLNSLQMSMKAIQTATGYVSAILVAANEIRQTGLGADLTNIVSNAISSGDSSQLLEASRQLSAIAETIEPINAAINGIKNTGMNIDLLPVVLQALQTGDATGLEQVSTKLEQSRVGIMNLPQ